MGSPQSSLGSSQVTVMVVVRSLSTLGVRGLPGTHCASAVGRASTNKASTTAPAAMAKNSRRYDAVDRGKRIALASPKRNSPTFQATTEKRGPAMKPVYVLFLNLLGRNVAVATEAQQRWPNRTGRW